MSDEQQKVIFSRNLNKYLTEYGKSQKEVAEAIGVIPSTFNTWCQGIALPRMGKVQALSDYFGINKSDLIDDKSALIGKTPSKGFTVNVLGRVAAGIPIEAITDIIDTEEISQDLAKTGEFFGLQIHGDSMEPRYINGQIVWVQQTEELESGEIGIFYLDGNAYCKKLDCSRTGTFLVSLNQKYDPIQITKNNSFKIFGKVVC